MNDTTIVCKNCGHTVKFNLMDCVDISVKLRSMFGVGFNYLMFADSMITCCESPDYRNPEVESTIKTIAGFE